jgi:hypothetical protein
VKAARRARPHDPEIDRPVAPRRLWSDEPFHLENQRLVANPFLALAAFCVWLKGAVWALEARHLGAFTGLLLLLGGVVWLLQFHCLDCGTTGVLFRWKGHACERALRRQTERRPIRFRTPNPVAQLVLWAYAVTVAAILAALVLRAHR